jgi:hypothetical protein
VLQRAGVPVDDADEALLVVGREEVERGAAAFAKAIGTPRDFSRESDPPRV